MSVENRIGRSIPSSVVPMSELTGPQQVEAKMLDLLAPVLASHSRFQGTDGARRLNGLLSSVTSIEDFELAFSKRFGARTLAKLKASVVEEYGQLNGLDPTNREVAVRMNLVAWARKLPESSSSAGTINTQSPRPETTPQDLAVSVEEQKGNGWSKTTGAGLPKGPGSYSGPEKQTRQQKRHNGRGRAGNGLH